MRVRRSRAGSTSAGAGKILAVGLIQSIDVFLMAIVTYITPVGFYALFVDDTLPLPRWLQTTTWRS